MRPEVSERAEALYQSLEPLAQGDEARGWPLLRFCEALTVSLAITDDQVRDRETSVGWEVLLDPDNTPDYALPYLAQFVGVVLEPALTVAQQREKIRMPENFARGGVAAMRQAAARTLIGDEPTVLIEERYGGDAYQLRVRTYASETPDPAATLAALLTQKPIGLVLDYDAVTGLDYADLEDFGTYDDLEAAVDSYDEIRTTLP